ncbi:hypothetical protein E2C01_036377 [Portunus trituberculatus]|uniref:Uncharacterized protein n=1 Tax=Portunus trituberculatus TaxID=210409 RepID=A0A5B7FBR1_PORTR|nr:hypothetical protein [Portunus trituberculatus]
MLGRKQKTTRTRRKTTSGLLPCLFEFLLTPEFFYVFDDYLVTVFYCLLHH